MTYRPILTIAVLCAVAGVFAGAAGAEPKNEWPFTRPAGNRGLAQASRQQQSATSAVPAGEPKNEWPFTRKAGNRGLAQANRQQQSATNAVPAGEPKNEWPFTRKAGTTKLVAGGAALVFTIAGAGLLFGRGARRTNRRPV